MSKTKVENLETPLGKYNKIMKICRLACAGVGCDIVDPHYKMNWVTGVTIISIVIYFGFTGFFIIEDWTILLEAFCMVGSVIQVNQDNKSNNFHSNTIYHRAFLNFTTSYDARGTFPILTFYWNEHIEKINIWAPIMLSLCSSLSHELALYWNLPAF